MQIFDFTNYKAFVRARVAEMPRKGRGEFARIAQALRMHTTSVSQVFRGDKDLSPEQAARLCRHWELTELESDYFLNLVELARAGAVELQALIRGRLEKIRKISHDLSHRVPKDRVLSEAERALFYSNWYYSAIRLLSDIPSTQTAESIASRLNLPRSLVAEALEFLLRVGLVVEERGRLRMGPKRTYLVANSLLVQRHHANWRQQAIARYERMDNERDLALTSPMTLSQDDALRVREVLVKTVEDIMRINTKSPSEELHVLNIDWLKL